MRETRKTINVRLKYLTMEILFHYKREIDVLKDIEHENIVRLIESGTSQEGHVFLAMELLEGISLKSYCTRSSKLTHVQARIGLVNILDALQSLHPDRRKV